MMKTIYVASGSAELGLVRDAIDALTKARWLITYDWSREPLWSRPASQPLTVHERRALALKDRDAVRRARFLWYRVPNDKSEGSADEFGYFSALRDVEPNSQRRIVVSGDVLRLGRIFPCLGDAHFDRHEDALKFLVSMA